MNYHSIHYGTEEIDEEWLLKSRLAYFTANQLFIRASCLFFRQLNGQHRARLNTRTAPLWGTWQRFCIPRPLLLLNPCSSSHSLFSSLGRKVKQGRLQGEQSKLSRVMNKHGERMHGILKRVEEMWWLQSLTWQNGRVRKEAGVQTKQFVSCHHC